MEAGQLVDRSNQQVSSNPNVGDFENVQRFSHVMLRANWYYK